MSFNPDKSHTLTLSPLSLSLSVKLPSDNPFIYFINNPLEEVQSFKLLGLTLSPDLSWENHISKLASKASHQLSILHSVNSFLGASELLFTDRTLIRSLMECCSPFWTSSPASHLAQLNCRRNQSSQYQWNFL